MTEAIVTADIPEALASVVVDYSHNALYDTSEYEPSYSWRPKMICIVRALAYHIRGVEADLDKSKEVQIFGLEEVQDPDTLFEHRSASQLLGVRARSARTAAALLYLVRMIVDHRPGMLFPDLACYSEQLAEKNEVIERDPTAGEWLKACQDDRMTAAQIYRVIQNDDNVVALSAYDVQTHEQVHFCNDDGDGHQRITDRTYTERFETWDTARVLDWLSKTFPAVDNPFAI